MFLGSISCATVDGPSRHKAGLGHYPSAFHTLVFLLLWCDGQCTVFDGEGRLLCEGVSYYSLFEPVWLKNSRLKPDNLFAFDATSFHPIYATTFLLNFYQHIIIEGRNFDSAVGQILNGSTLSRHSGIVRFWRDGDVVRKCVLRWAHLRTQPWGRAVLYQCPSCGCIQAWDQQKIQGASSQLRDVSMRCSYKGVQGQGCKKCLTFEKPPEEYKAVKASEGIWVAFGVEKSEFL